MSIASRISAIEQHLEEDYNVLELAGADLSNVDKNIVNLSPTWKERLLYFINNGTDVVYNNWEKVSGEGETLTLNNTLEARMKIELKGNTYQYSTSGKNKFNVSDVSQATDNRGLTYKVENNVFTISGTNTSTSDYSLTNWTDNITRTYFDNMFEKGKTFTLSSNNNVSGLYFQINYFKEGSSSQTRLVKLENLSGKATFTIPQDFYRIASIFLGVYGTATTINGSFSLQLEEGSEKTSFEPYTNGASPNPDYPQDIQVVSGDNTIKVEGKNLFDKNSATVLNALISTATHKITASAGRSTTYIEIKPNTTYTVSKILSSRFVIATFTDLEAEYTNKAEGATNTSLTVTSGANDKYLAVFFYHETYDTTITSQQILDSIMIEKGNTASETYTPYVSQSYPINLGDIELCKIGDYQDSIKKSTGKNLFDEQYPNILSSDTLRYRAIYVGNGTFTMSSNIPLTPQNRFANIFFLSGNVSTGAATGTNGVYLNRPITTQSENGYVTIAYRNYENISPLNYQTMLNKGTTALPYEPYGTSWYLNKQIGKVVYVGAETEQWGPYTTHVFRTQPITEIRNCLSNFYIFNSTEFMGQLSNGQFGIANAQNQYALCVRDDRFDTATELKEWLNTHYLSIYYPLNTPTYTEITDTTLLSQLNALGNANSYNNQTNINQDSNDLASILNASALEEM